MHLPPLPLLLLVAVVTSTALTPVSVVSNGRLNVGDATSYHGNDVFRRSGHVTDGGLKSYVDVSSPLATGILKRFFLFADPPSESVTGSTTRIQIWRPNGTKFQLVWQSRVFLNASAQGLFYSFDVYGDRFKVQSTDYIGWTNEELFSLLSYDVQTTNHSLRVRSLMLFVDGTAQYPAVGSSYSFDSIPIVAVFSVAVEIEPAVQQCQLDELYAQQGACFRLAFPTNWKNSTNDRICTYYNQTDVCIASWIRQSCNPQSIQTLVSSTHNTLGSFVTDPNCQIVSRSSDPVQSTVRPSWICTQQVFDGCMVNLPVVPSTISTGTVSAFCSQAQAYQTCLESMGCTESDALYKKYRARLGQVQAYRLFCSPRGTVVFINNYPACQPLTLYNLQHSCIQFPSNWTLDSQENICGYFNKMYTCTMNGIPNQCIGTVSSLLQQAFITALPYVVSSPCVLDAVSCYTSTSPGSTYTGISTSSTPSPQCTKASLDACVTNAPVVPTSASADNINTFCSLAQAYRTCLMMMFCARSDSIYRQYRARLAQANVYPSFCWNNASTALAGSPQCQPSSMSAVQLSCFNMSFPALWTAASDGDVCSYYNRMYSCGVRNIPSTCQGPICNLVIQAYGIAVGYIIETSCQLDTTVSCPNPSSPTTITTTTTPTTTSTATTTPTTTVTTTPQLPLRCPILTIDLVFLLDSSARSDVSAWGKMLKFVNSIVEFFYVGENSVRVALVRYSDQPSIAIGLNDFTDKTNLKAAILGVQNVTGGSNLTAALEGMRKQVFGTGSTSQKVAIIVTDYVQDVTVDGLMTAINSARAANISMFGVGLWIAGRPFVHNTVYQLSYHQYGSNQWPATFVYAYNEMERQAQNLSVYACGKPLTTGTPATPTTPTTTSSASTSATKSSTLSEGTIPMTSPTSSTTTTTSSTTTGTTTTTPTTKSSTLSEGTLPMTPPTSSSTTTTPPTTTSTTASTSTSKWSSTTTSEGTTTSMTTTTSPTTSATSTIPPTCTQAALNRCDAIKPTVLPNLTLSDLPTFIRKANEYDACLQPINCQKTDPLYRVYRAALGFSQANLYVSNRTTGFRSCSAGNISYAQRVCFTSSFPAGWLTASYADICRYFNQMYSCWMDSLGRQCTQEVQGLSLETYKVVLPYFVEDVVCTMTTPAPPPPTCTQAALNQCDAIKPAVLPNFTLTDLPDFVRKAKEYDACLQPINCQKTDPLYRVYRAALGFSQANLYVSNKTTGVSSCSAGNISYAQQVCFTMSFPSGWLTASYADVCRYFNLMYNCWIASLGRQCSQEVQGLSSETYNVALPYFVEDVICTMTTTPPPPTCTQAALDNCDALKPAVLPNFTLADLPSFISKARQYDACLQPINCQRTDPLYRVYRAAVGMSKANLYVSNKVGVTTDFRSCSAYNISNAQRACFSSSFPKGWQTASYSDVCRYFNQMYICWMNGLGTQCSQEVQNLSFAAYGVVVPYIVEGVNCTVSGH